MQATQASRAAPLSLPSSVFQPLGPDCTQLLTVSPQCAWLISPLPNAHSGSSLFLTPSKPSENHPLQGISTWNPLEMSPSIWKVSPSWPRAGEGRGDAGAGPAEPAAQQVHWPRTPDEQTCCSLPGPAGPQKLEAGTLFNVHFQESHRTLYKLQEHNVLKFPWCLGSLTTENSSKRFRRKASYQWRKNLKMKEL